MIMTATVMTVMVKGKMEWEEGSARTAWLQEGGEGRAATGRPEEKGKRGKCIFTPADFRKTRLFLFSFCHRRGALKQPQVGEKFRMPRPRPRSTEGKGKLP